VRAHEAVGEDVKIMGRRSGDSVRLTVAAAVVGEEVAGIDEYVEVKESVRRLVEENSHELFEEVEVAVNAADDIAEGEVYLTVTGLSLESGDDGAVGRGNRTNGLITPNRPMSIEAVAGKNPVTHVGKLYNVLARRAAERISDEDDADGYAEVSLLSEIGRRVYEPACVEVVTTASEDAAVRAVRDELGRLDELTEEVIEGDVRLF
jgi:S-adenosylmethionine synthetase